MSAARPLTFRAFSQTLLSNVIYNVYAHIQAPTASESTIATRPAAPQEQSGLGVSIRDTSTLIEDVTG